MSLAGFSPRTKNDTNLPCWRGPIRTQRITYQSVYFITKGLSLEWELASLHLLQDCTPESALERHLRWSKGLVPLLSEQAPLYSAVRSLHPGATVPHSLQLSAVGELVRTGQQSSHWRSRVSSRATMRFLKIRHKTRLSMSWLQECLTVGRTLPSWVTSLWEQGTRSLLSLHPKHWS